jgi:hypothetical protein
MWLSVSKVNVEQNARNGDGLKDDAPAHDFVGVFFVEFTARGECAKADHQGDKHGQHSDNDEDV